VLVVDDEPLVADVLCSMLTAAGYRVSRAADAATALRLLGLPDDPVQVALVDRRLPGMNGSHLLRALRQLDPRLQAVLISGEPPTDEERAQHPDVPFLLKPITMPDLLATVRRALSFADAAAAPPS